jgi:DNA replication and repair protein RecF
MRINKLALTNFRSYNSLELELQPGVITFIGDNGSGKTNIAESLIYLAFLSSHRVSNNVPSHLETNKQLFEQKFNAKIEPYKLI